MPLATDPAASIWEDPTVFLSAQWQLEERKAVSNKGLKKRGSITLWINPGKLKQ